MHIMRATAGVLFWVGIFLMGLNMLGFVVPLRNPNIYLEPRIDNLPGIILTEKQLNQTLEQIEFTSTTEHVTKINDAIHRGMINIQLDRAISDFNFRIPPHENFILFFASYLYPDKYTIYEFCDERKAIERGVGLCSQQVGVLSQILYKNDIASRTVDLKEHIVALVQVDRTTDLWWIIDPDYGVVIPYNIQQIEQDPSIVASFYEEKGYKPNTVKNLVGLYGREDKAVRERKKSSYFQNICTFERKAYIAKWVIPLALVLPSLFFLRKKHRKRT